MGMIGWRDWANEIADCVKSIPDDDLRFAAKLIRQSEIVLTAGNGGSSSLAHHAAQAIMKPDYASGGGHAAVCLTDNIATFTAHANDNGWTHALREMARPYLRAYTRPLLLLFSSSGKSTNIIHLAHEGRQVGEVIAFTGFDGEPLKSIASLSIHVKSHDYEVVEPVHDALLHRMQYHLRQHP